MPRSPKPPSGAIIPLYSVDSPVGRSPKMAAPVGPAQPDTSTVPAVAPLAGIELQAVCRWTGQAAFAVGVQHVDRNAVGSCLQHAMWQRVAPLAGAVLAADGDPFTQVTSTSSADASSRVAPRAACSALSITCVRYQPL